GRRIVGDDGHGRRGHDDRARRTAMHPPGSCCRYGHQADQREEGVAPQMPRRCWLDRADHVARQRLAAWPAVALVQVLQHCVDDAHTVLINSTTSIARAKIARPANATCCARKRSDAVSAMASFISRILTHFLPRL